MLEQNKVASTAFWLTLASVAGVGVWMQLRSRGTSRGQRQATQLKSIADAAETPLVVIPSLSRITGCTIVGKMEMLSVGGSSKDRLARAVIEQAERDHLITPHQGHIIVEGTVGSTGISLATIANAKGYKALIIMPDDQAQEKYELLTQLGATIEKVRPVSIADPNHFVRVAERRAKEINKSGERNSDGNPIRAFFVNQFETPQVGIKNLDSFVMGAGTGGTLAGVSMFLKSKMQDLRVVLADPEGSGLFHKVKSNIMYSPTEAEGTRKRHQVDTIVEGIGINRVTHNFQTALKQPNLISNAVKVTDREAVEMSRFILRNDGLFCGSSTAVHLVAAYREAKQLGPGHTVLTFLCDSGTRHLTKFWNDKYIKKAGLEPKSSGADVDFL
ncbi:hypothetical protein HDU78_008561 [Chytriomyces hyalinus]|nr:hypothetical protein HDU78_008561 [Chytriomyces hyalinus]